MGMEFQKYTLGDICSRLSSGKNIKASNVHTQGMFPVYGGNGLRGYANESNFKGNCAIIGRQGAYCGNVRYFEGEGYMTEHAVVAQGKDFVDNYYLACLLSTMHLENLSGQSAQPGLAVGTLAKQEVEIPSYKDQKRIADILSSLDAKIENNNKINAKLEEMAQALFKSWFIDFEPFKDGNFVESELGMIPEGWKVGCYNDIIEGTVSGDWGKESPIANYTHHVACVRGCDFQDIKNGVRGKTPERYILEKNYQNKKLQHHDILVEISGGTATVSTGRICLVTDTLIDKYDKDIVCTNFCRVARPKEGYSAYIFYSWQWKYNNRVMFGYENGTSGIKNFQMTGFLDKELLIIPPKDAIAKFQTIIDDLYKKIQINGSEITKLAQTRDTLLPKLMSGEFEI